MLGNFDLEKLRNAKQALEDLKAFKLAVVADKHLEDPLDKFALLRHFHQEIEELDKAFFHGSPEQILEELADIENMIDIIFMKMETKE